MKRLGPLLLALGLAFGAAAAPADPAAQGRAIYEQGVLPDGSPLVGQRLGAEVRGAAAACVHCHRRSGLGVVEGDQAIAPISGRALFGGGDRVVTVMDPVRGKALNLSHEPYDEAAVAQAIRAGAHPSGRPMHELMPRYQLDDAALQALLAHLRTLSVSWSPGVDEQTIRFATVVTPDVDAPRRQAFLDTLRAAFSQKNGSTMPGRRHMVMAAEFTLRTERRWELEVWELKGPATAWPAQLEQHLQRTPVFAVVSGLGGGDWSPVHRFCETQQLPCWFPSVASAPTEPGRWSLYFSAGAVLEAEVLAEQWLAATARPRHVLQLVGAGEGAAAAARTLAQALQPARLVVESVPFGAHAAALARASAGDAVVGWLSPDELAALGGSRPPRASVLLSASLGGAERMPLPAPWKAAARLVYPYQLPALRGPNLATFKTWLAQRGIPLVDELLQSEVYFAVNYLRDTLGEMLNNLHREYLVERAENMLSLRESRKANEETLERQTIRQRYLHVIENSARAVSAADSLGRRSGTTAYPALGLGPGQRFASKGAYIVRFTGPDTTELQAESPWLVP